MMVNVNTGNNMVKITCGDHTKLQSEDNNWQCCIVHTECIIVWSCVIIYTLWLWVRCEGRQKVIIEM